MNDSNDFNGKNGKVKVMYVRSEGQDAGHSKGKRQQDNKRTNDRRGGGGRRNERSGRFDDRKSQPPREHSAWRTVSKPNSDELIHDHGGIAGKSQIDPEQLRKQRLEETRIYGENACQAMFKNRPEAIVRAWFLQSVTPRFRDALKWMAANRKAYHVVDDEELTKASGTEHHGGVCFLIKKRGGMSVETYLQQAPATDCVLALEDVGNPHNLGGIMRSCAHFGVQGVILQDAGVVESGAAIRTAEGGAEHIKAIDADGLSNTLSQFRQAGYTIVTTSSHKGSQDISKAKLPAKMVLVLGQERDGLSDSVWNEGDMSLYIGGTGKVESLNVSVATGIMLAQWWQQNKAN
ncbi:tRNA/rRNA methyltransferase [Providencia stuartii]|uniref:RNA methyltransferase, TrmH family n=3 Tax=Gammaproteobacteria TaxID=1236 RepID=A0AA86YGF6_PROST|nr:MULTISPECIES: tRNA/rRNA methyltransferase [Providencia]AFH94871.1 putative methyltransferase [Providencia stuartii MRSN 2154]AIN62714.1 RNA 2'-O ribose methyltransferase substrate binding family protein [Providencia stuartii]AXO20177.1 tRNA/rRNA methyltransferase [Providencia stuartii]EDU58282.1 RNA methyltransferase, TrmH family [Providencia stuartii ATCC 25827]MBG5897113.1 tRNA/rRNA methyltransferase [Providencia stuartii]